MKTPHVRCFAVLSLLAFWACATPVQSDSATPIESTGELHVVVLHTNDIHGQVLAREATWLGKEDPPLTGGLPRVAAYIERMRSELRDSETELIVLDAGDWSQGTPEGQIERGRAFVRMLNHIDYDAMCLGNHEFDHGLEALEGLLAEIDMPVTTVNVVDVNDRQLLDNVSPYIKLDVGGMSVAVVGLLSPETPKITHADARTDLWFQDPAGALAALQGFTSDSIDWWLPVTHLGHVADIELAEKCGLPLIVGGHSHRYLREGIRVGDSLVVQAGCKSTVVGRVDLWFDKETHQVLRSTAQLIDLLEEPTAEFRIPELEEECSRLVAQSAQLMDEVVGELAADLTRSRDPLQSSPAGNLIADVTRSAVDAEVGVMNRGGIRVNLSAGPVTRRDMFEICPFDNFTVKLEMTGAELFEFMRRSVADAEHSGLEVSGMTPLVTADRKLVGLRVAGADYEVARKYTVALNSFLAGGGDGFLDPEQKATMSPIEDPRLLRHLLEELFQAEGRVNVDATNRYEVVQ